MKQRHATCQVGLKGSRTNLEGSRIWQNPLVTLVGRFMNQLKTFMNLSLHFCEIIFPKEYLTCDHFRDMTQSLLALELVFIGKLRPMQNLPMKSSTYTTLNNGRVPFYNTRLGSIKYSIPELGQHFPQLRFQQFQILCHDSQSLTHSSF